MRESESITSTCFQSDCLQQGFYLGPGRQVLGESAGGAGAETHTEGLFEVASLDHAGQEAGYHGITGADGIDQCAFGRGTAQDITFFGNEDRAFTRHGNQNVTRAPFLQLLRVGNNLILGLQGNAVNFAQLDVIGLDQIGMIFEDIDQKAALRVYDNPDSAPVQTCHDP